MSCEDFDYGKMLSHLSILYPWLLCSVGIRYFKLIGTGITFCPCVTAQGSFWFHLISCHLSVLLLLDLPELDLLLGLQQE